MARVNSAGLSARAARRPAAGLPARDRFCQLALGHVRAALDSELASAPVELLLGVGFDIDAAIGLAVVFARPRVSGPRVRRAGPSLRLPVIAPLLEGVLQRRVRDTMGSFTLAVLLHSSVVRLGERPLG